MIANSQLLIAAWHELSEQLPPLRWKGVRRIMTKLLKRKPLKVFCFARKKGKLLRLHNWVYRTVRTVPLE